jgi:hypothetical protein
VFVIVALQIVLHMKYVAAFVIYLHRKHQICKDHDQGGVVLHDTDGLLQVSEP